MNAFKNKVLLVAGYTEGIGQTVMHHALECGAKEIRVFDNNEERLVAMRNDLLTQQPSAVAMVKYYCAEVSDSESVDDSMPGVDLVLCIPALKTVTDIESYPADACRDLLDSVDNVMQSGINHGAEKVVVLIPAYKEPLYKTPDLLAALLEKVVIAQGRYQMKGAKTTVCSARKDDDIIALIDYTFVNAKNGDLVERENNGYLCHPCYNPDFKRDDLTNI